MIKIINLIYSIVCEGFYMKSLNRIHKRQTQKFAQVAKIPLAAAANTTKPTTRTNKKQQQQQKLKMRKNGFNHVPKTVRYF